MTEKQDEQIKNLKTQVDILQTNQETSGALELRDMLKGPTGLDFEPKSKRKERKEKLKPKKIESKRPKKLSVKRSSARNISSSKSEIQEKENNDNVHVDASENHSDEHNDHV